MAKDPSKRPIIIKKIKKGGHAHHGGAWKVAYADFVTAMMAFFLLLWLLAQAPKEKLVGLADYFAPTVGLKERVGVGLKGASGDIDNGIKIKPGGMPSVMPGAPPTTGDVPQAPQADTDEIVEEEKLEVSQNEAEKIAEALDKKHFDEIQKELKEAIEKNPELKEFQDNIKVTQTAEGLQIEITDLDGISMFEIGSSNLRIQTQPLIAKISETIQKVDNKVSIIGHTDSLGYKNSGDYSNWELSSDRANASRRFLVNTGLEEDRVFKVEGKADREPMAKNDPSAPQNRRISIILLKKSLVPVDGAAPKPGQRVDVAPVKANEEHSAADTLSRYN